MEVRKRNRFTVEQIIRMLREAEVHLSQGKSPSQGLPGNYLPSLICFGPIFTAASISLQPHQRLLGLAQPIVHPYPHEGHPPLTSAQPGAGH